MTSPRTTAIRTGAAVTIAFALTHVYWAAGGTIGVPTGESVTDRPVFLAYDVASAIALFVAAGLALRLVDRPTPLLTRLTLVGAAVALLRGLVGVVQGGALLAGGHGVSVGSVYDLWFTVVGALFVSVAVTDRRRLLAAA